MRKILLADDDKSLLEYILNFISKDDRDNVDLAETAEKAIEMIRKNKYDKAVIDLNFIGEDLTGFDILEEAKIKCIPERIVFTSVSNQMNLFDSGATAAFRKPLSSKKIANFLITDDYDLLKEDEIF